MSKCFQYFRKNATSAAVLLPFDIETIIDDWCGLRKKMVRSVPAAFTRDEWAYILMFIERGNLLRPFQCNFGELCDKTESPLSLLAKPRGNIALWLPNNVSLLGPLMLILVSLTGNPLRMKGGTRSENITGIFRDYVLASLGRVF